MPLRFLATALHQPSNRVELRLTPANVRTRTVKGKKEDPRNEWAFHGVRGRRKRGVG